MNLPYDILLNIYFKLDDYCTLKNLFLLNKTFYYNYLRSYKKTVYQHLINQLSKELFTILYEIPNVELNTLADYYNNESVSLQENNSKLITKLNYYFIRNSQNELFKLFLMYKNFIFNEMKNYFGERYINMVGYSLTNIILIQGYDYINKNINIDIKICDIGFNIQLSKKSKNIIGNFNTSCPFRYLKQYLIIFENTLNLNDNNEDNNE